MPAPASISASGAGGDEHLGQQAVVSAVGRDHFLLIKGVGRITCHKKKKKKGSKTPNLAFRRGGAVQIRRGHLLGTPGNVAICAICRWAPVGIDSENLRIVISNFQSLGSLLQSNHANKHPTSEIHWGDNKTTIGDSQGGCSVRCRFIHLSAVFCL